MINPPEDIPGFLRGVPGVSNVRAYKPENFGWSFTIEHESDKELKKVKERVLGGDFIGIVSISEIPRRQPRRGRAGN